MRITKKLLMMGSLLALLMTTGLPVMAQEATTNVSLNKGTTQSSTAYEHDGYSERAVDGNTDGYYWHNSVTHTEVETNPWWEVDLGKTQDINKINIWNRTDCCQERLNNFYVFVSDTPFTSNDPTVTAQQANVTAFYKGGLAPRTTYIDVNTTGRYVRIQIVGPGTLSLAEVEVLHETVAPITTSDITSSQPIHNGWYTNDVSVALSATDNNGGSGVKETNYKVGNGDWGPYTSPISLSEGEHTIKFYSIDNSGNNETEQTQVIKVDKTDPVITTLSDRSTFTLNEVIMWSASDALSGLATETNGSIDTSTVGPKTITATDNAGNTVTSTYKVVYGFGGVLQPINSDNTSIFKLGRTLPVKFKLIDANGAYISTANATISYSYISTNVLGEEVESDSNVLATFGNQFRYDTSENQYIFNLSTKGLKIGSYKLMINLNDGSGTKEVRIALR
ncbi:PxKF domain-containing protein [Paenisporosarcina sp. TG20]|uniref:galactose-binding domain-containing protein n=1 Tax=Paenisporosarcina sp. TG20 TaxID=1211706 RepID=UPI0002F8898D|nr:PxKF domain-containing protein [Paenisporosarcina sp. TG20]